MRKMMSFTFGVLIGTIVATAYANYSKYPAVDSPNAAKGAAMNPFELMSNARGRCRLSSTTRSEGSPRSFRKPANERRSLRTSAARAPVPIRTKEDPGAQNGNQGLLAGWVRGWGAGGTPPGFDCIIRGARDRSPGW